MDLTNFRTMERRDRAQCNDRALSQLASRRWSAGRRRKMSRFDPHEINGFNKKDATFGFG